MNKAPHLVASLALLLAQPVHAQAPLTNLPSDCLFFRNGDTLYGKLVAVDPPDLVRWQHPDVSDPIDFNADRVLQIDFPQQSSPARHLDFPCSITLANGDALSGNFVSCDRQTVILDTWYAGLLQLPRRGVLSVAFVSRAPALFDGITGMDGWTRGKGVEAFSGNAGDWVYRHGGFYADKPASIARDVKLPPLADIEFDLAWKGTLNLAVALYTDSLQPILLTEKDKGPDFGGFYSLRFLNSVFITLWPIRKNEPQRTLGDLVVPSLNNKDRVHVGVRASKEDRRIALYLDGSLVRDWIDPAGFVGEGTGVRFVQNSTSPVKLSNLRVTKWNGVLDQGDTVSTEDPAHDTVSVDSGAKVSGAVDTIARGRISLLTTNGMTPIALTRANAIEFARARSQPFKPAAGSVRATFAQGGVVTFELLSWRPDGVVVVSPDFGKATFDPAAFSRLQFLAPDPKS
jgi:hypothetical protein